MMFVAVSIFMRSVLVDRPNHGRVGSFNKGGSVPSYVIGSVTGLKHLGWRPCPVMVLLLKDVQYKPRGASPGL